MNRQRTQGKKCFNLFLTGIMTGMILLGIAVQPAQAAYSASVYLQAGSVSDDDGGWGDSSAGGTLNNLYGQASASAGFFGSSPVVSATAVGSNPGYAKAIAGIDDGLIFSGSANDWYSNVTIHIAGNWSISLDPAIDNHGTAPWVRFSLGLTRQGTPLNTYDSWRSLVSGSVQSSQTYLDTVVTGSWSEFSDSDAWSASGTYSFDFTTRVYDGWNYLLGLAVIAEAPAGASAYIDDPIVINLPDGMSFTASSISKYSEPSSVPIPSAVFLLGSGIFGLAGVRRRMK